MELDDNTLVAYVDGEIDAAGAAAVERRLRTDAGARNKVAALSQSAVMLRAAFNAALHESVPPRLLDVLDRPAHQRRRIGVPVAAAIAGLVIGLAGGFLASDSITTPLHEQQRAADTRIEEIAAYHAIFARDTEYLVEVPADRVERLEEWVGENLKRRLSIPDLSADGFEFLGGRLLVAGGQPVSQLMYAAPHHEPLAICITTAGSGDRAPSVVFSHGLTLVSWQKEGFLYVLVGAESEPYLRALARRYAPMLERT